METVCTDANGVNETWKPVAIEPFGSAYECSDLGNVRRIGKRRPLKPGMQSRGYMCVVLYVPDAKPKQPKSFTVHRIVATTFLDGPPKPQINHKDGNKANNAVTNIEWVTAVENVQHAILNGLARLGGRNYSKLSETDARDVLRLSACGVTDKLLGKIFSVSESCVRHLRIGKTWASLPRLNEHRQRGAKTAADIRRAKSALTRFLNARKPQRPRVGTADQQPHTSEDLPGSAA